MKRLIFSTLFTFIILCLSAQSYQSKETTEYINLFRKTAIREMYKHKIPASITLAQGILESGSGRSDLATRANNHFGIKCAGDYSGEKYYKDDDKKNDCFRVYDHADESFRDHSLFLKKARYASLFDLKTTDYKGWAKGLKKAGYATNPKYPDLLIAIIEQNKLYEYDKNPGKYLSESDAENYALNGRVSPEGPIQGNVVIAPKVTKNKINGVKCIKVQSGQTFYSLSKQLGMTVEQLQTINDFPSNYVLKAGEYIFVEPKKKKNKSAGNHIVQAGESWLSISQLYGVKKVRLMKMNRAKSDYIKVGASLRLH